jgi:hypothetical protein
MSAQWNCLEMFLSQSKGFDNVLRSLESIKQSTVLSDVITERRMNSHEHLMPSRLWIVTDESTGLSKTVVPCRN